jgi:hypothetical protein
LLVTSLVSGIKTLNTTQEGRLTAIETINATQSTDITGIKTLNTTQDNRLTTIETVNTTQSTSISNNANAITSLTSRVYTVEQGRVLRCRLTCSSGVRAVENNHRFRQFENTKYVFYYNEGHIKLLLTLYNGPQSTDFSVSGSGCQVNPPSRTNVMWVMPGDKAPYYLGSDLVGHTCELYFVRAYGTEFANIQTTGFFDLVIKF